MDLYTLLHAFLLLGLAILTKMVHDSDKEAKSSRQELQDKIDDLSVLLNEILDGD